MSDSFQINPSNWTPQDWLISGAGGLEGKVRAAQGITGDKQKRELKKVAQEFEAIFLAQMLKVMRETIEESGLTESGLGNSIYTELFDQELSLSLARRSPLGLSDLLYKCLVNRVKEHDEGSAGQEIGGATSFAPDSSRDTPTVAERFEGEEKEITDLQLPVKTPASSGFGLKMDPITRNPRLRRRE